MSGQMIAQDTAPAVGKLYWGSGHAGLMKKYCDEQQYFNVYDVRNTMETMFAMYESAKNGGKEVKVEQKKSILQNDQSVL